MDESGTRWHHATSTLQGLGINASKQGTCFGIQGEVSESMLVGFLVHVRLLWTQSHILVPLP